MLSILHRSVEFDIIGHEIMLQSTLMTSQGSDTVTSIFECNSSNTTTSLRLLKMAQFA